MTTEIVMSVLDSAIQNQQPTDGLIIQTDLSSQYTSADFEEALRMNKMTHSYSRKGTLRLFLYRIISRGIEERRSLSNDLSFV